MIPEQTHQFILNFCSKIDNQLFFIPSSIVSDHSRIPKSYCKKNTLAVNGGPLWLSEVDSGWVATLHYKMMEISLLCAKVMQLHGEVDLVSVQWAHHVLCSVKWGTWATEYNDIFISVWGICNLTVKRSTVVTMKCWNRSYMYICIYIYIMYTMYLDITSPRKKYDKIIIHIFHIYI